MERDSRYDASSPLYLISYYHSSMMM